MKKKFVISGVFAGLFIWLAVALKLVDVRAIGPNESSIGLAGLNGAVFGFFGTHEIWDKITDVAIVLALATVVIFAVIGVMQLVQRKKLAKIDKELFALLGLYVAMAVLYVLFEKVRINFRPVLEADGALEASFPSTHTLVSCVTTGAMLILAKKYIKNRKACVAVQVTCVLLAILVPCGRIFAGVHWFTDVLGGYLLSGALLALFAGAVEALGAKKKSKS